MNLSKFNFYNESLKREFLSQYSGDSQLTIAYILDKSTSTEYELKKDLATFNEDEIGLVLHIISPINMRSALRYAGMISSYIDWGISKGLSSSNLNPLDGLSKEWYQQFVGNKKIVFSYNDIKEIMADLVNFQDKLPILLAFEGVLGEDMSEQCNLNRNSYDINSNKLKLKDDVKGEREIEVSDECLAMINSAYNETTYLLKNGMSEGKAKEKPLVDSVYVLKPAQTKNTEANSPIQKFTLYRRLREIKDLFNQPFLSYKNLHKSGQIKMAVDLFQNRGKLDNEELEMIAEHYNLNKTVSGGEAYNFSAMREYINRENILELYGVDINA